MSSRCLQFVQSSVGKVFTIIAVMLVTLGFSSTLALAKTSEVDVPVYGPSPDTPILRGNTGDLVAFSAGSISNGEGEIECDLVYGNYWVDFQASTGYNNGATGTVDCYIEFPSGNIYSLGLISASNGQTAKREFYFAPFGTYKFIFESSNLSELDVSGFIYD